MRVVVTGGAGFVGTHVVERLITRGADVRVVDDMSSGDVRNLVTAFRLGLRESVVHLADIRSRYTESLIRGCRPDVVVHLAAQTSVARAHADPAGDAAVNVAGTANVIHAAAHADAKVVFAASCAMYGEVPHEALPVSEHRAWNPADAYGLSKETGLRYLRLAAGRHGLNYAALVLGNVYGPRQRPPSVVPAFLEALRAGKPARMPGKGVQTRDFVYVTDVTDVAEAIVAACEHGRELIVNIGSGVETSIRDLYRFLAATVGRPELAVERGRDISVGVPCMRLDIRGAASNLGWTPRVDLRTGLDLVVASSLSPFRVPAQSGT